jgi:type I restriction enzyme M protein
LHRQRCPRDGNAVELSKSSTDKFSYDELKARDRTSLDVFWLRDKSLTDLDNVPEPDELGGGIIENLEAGLNSFREVLAVLNKVA